MLEHKQLRTAVLVVPHPGANLTVIDPEGVVRAVIGFAGGLHKLGDFMQYFPPDSEYVPTEGAVIAERSGDRMRIMGNPLMAETGANLEYEPMRLTDTEKLMMRQLSHLQARVARTDKRAKLAEERAAAKVLDKAPEPEPEPAPAPAAEVPEPVEPAVEPAE